MIHDFCDQSSRDEGLSKPNFVSHQKTSRARLAVHFTKHILHRVPLEVAQPEQLLVEVRSGDHVSSCIRVVAQPKWAPITLQTREERSPLDSPVDASPQLDLRYDRAALDSGRDYERAT